MTAQSTPSSDGSLWRAIVIIVVLLVAIPFVMMLTMGPMTGGWGVGHMNGWMWDESGSAWAWMLSWLFMLGILIGGGYLVYRALSTPRASSDAAIEELRSAYARGELTDEEFETRRARLDRD